MDRNHSLVPSTKAPLQRSFCIGPSKTRAFSRTDAARSLAERVLTTYHLLPTTYYLILTTHFLLLVGRAGTYRPV